MQFTALKDFFSDATKSQYVAGLNYTAGPNDNALLALIPVWVDEKKIVLGGPAAALSGTDQKSWFSKLMGR